MKSNYIDNLNAEEIGKKYLAGVKIADLAVGYGVHRSTIERLVHKAGIKPSKQLFIARPFSEYQNKQERDYWLGFLFGDGYIINSTLGLTLQVSDRNHLVKYAKFLGTNKIPIQYTYTDISYCRVNYCHVDELKYLKSIGIVTNKTFTGNYTEPITWDFINGLIDADGCITRTRIAISSSNENQVLQVLDFFEKEGVKVNCTTILPSQKKGLTMPHYTINLNISQIKAVVKDKLYNNEYSLNRKRIKYESYFK